jgi:hypothetical protein
MGFFDQIVSAMGGREHIERFTRGEANFAQGSPDLERWNQIVAAAPPEQLRDSIALAAQRVGPAEYHEHITPGLAGTDPLGGLSKGPLAKLATSLVNHLGAGGALAGLIPGLRATDPSRMAPDDVAKVADHAHHRDPDAFSRAAVEVGREQPNVLQSLLGNKALMLGAAVLGAKILADRSRQAS